MAAADERGHARWIDATAQLERRLAAVGSGPVAVDCEADSLHHYPEKVCLVQLSFAGSDLLVDPLAGVDLARLGPLLADPAVPKIFHGADYDLRVLDRDFGLVVRGLRDTAVAARLVGERAFGLAALLDAHLHLQIEKKHQRADWSRRPLPAEMREYAATDTRYLEPLWRRIEARLRELGRLEWALEEFGLLEQVRWSGPDGEPWRRVKGSQTLDPRGLAVLRALHAWREGEALRRDRPPFKILRDDVLLGIATVRPRTVDRLAEVRGLAPSWRSGARARALVQAVAGALELPDEVLPPRKLQRRTRLDPRVERRVRELRKRRDVLAADLGLEPSVLASRALLEALATHGERGEDPGALPVMSDWRRALLVPLLSTP